jgi:CubicO group peptidase (beta-lactamase class C family)
MKHALIAGMLVCAIGVAAISAEDKQDAGLSLERLHRIGPKLKEYMDNDKLAGAVSLVYRRGKIVDVQVVGWQDREKKIPMRRDTIFRLASMTKPITAVATMMLIDDGKMAFDDPIARWLPELGNRRVLPAPDSPLDQAKPSRRQVTVRDLLMYRYGLGMNTGGPGTPITKASAGLRQGNPSMDEWLKRLGGLPLVFSPGDRFTYNTPSEILGALIARVSGMPFEQFLQQRIFQPLGMKDTTFWVPPEKRDRLAASYTVDESGKLQPTRSVLGSDAVDKPPLFPSGAGGLSSTVDDYATFARMLLKRGQADGIRYLSPKAVDVMTTNYMTREDRTRANFGDVFDAQGFGYGLAIIVEGGFIGPSVGSFHWDGASGASWIADPKEDMITIVLLQQYNYPEHSKVLRDVRQLAYSAIVN